MTGNMGISAALVFLGLNRSDRYSSFSFDRPIDVAQFRSPFCVGRHIGKQDHAPHASTMTARYGGYGAKPPPYASPGSAGRFAPCELFTVHATAREAFGNAVSFPHGRCALGSARLILLAATAPATGAIAENPHQAAKGSPENGLVISAIIECPFLSYSGHFSNHYGSSFCDLLATWHIFIRINLNQIF